MHKRIFLAVLLAAPAFAFAQGTGKPIEQTLETIKSLINMFLGFALPLAIAFFFWGLIKFIRNAQNAELKKDGKNIMVNSGIALLLMVGIWSILGYVSKSVGLENQDVTYSDVPTVKVFPDAR